MRVDQTARQLGAITRALIALSRLYALRLLADPDRHAKLDAATRSAVLSDLALLVAEFATRHYQHKPGVVAWPPALHPERSGMLSNGQVDAALVAKQIGILTHHILSSLCALDAAAATTLMAAPIRPLITQVRAALPDSDDVQGVLADYSADYASPVRPCKVLNGPAQVRTDPIFKVGYTLLDERVPVFGQSLRESVRYLWTVCVGETMAAELCALSSIEYDGLPMAFYRDMGKQAWDEMRHAVGYLDVAIGMLPSLAASLDRDDPLRGALTTFERDGRGLPIPRELNLYETILNCSLEERLILFQIQTEAPGASRKKENLRSDLCRQYPDLAAVLEYDLRDEISHARIGRTWLAHLLPDPAARREAVADTSLLRSVLLMTSFAHHGGGSLGTLLDRYLGRAALVQ